ncbi:DNA ligase [Salinisphaera hydrothermalis]|uniref:DNA ligase n=1 Tax=Salinisphaera hydrothermalis (strain C41B8) TaxID=1304275 RepID=A0A084IHJ4_SALHC|nr:DNA ligase [Salinisphaera hydrothermalis]KEZ76178.1 DNA ligase [Salinisphaera hydrothermalis C41B8]
MKHIVGAVSITLAAFVFAGPAAEAASPPPVELVDVYQGHADLSQYWVSEKYDGVRGYWDGQRMLTRGGSVIALPAWFTADLPDTPMDGELWAGYGRFSDASTLVRTAGPDDPRWHEISYRIFDLPGRTDDFNDRVPAIRRVVSRIDDPWVVAIRQFHVANDEALRSALKKVLAKGGEGLVLHRGSRDYTAGRHAGLLKVKPYQDAEARVVGIHPGHGRLKGMMGSLEVRMPDGRQFAIGTGFSDDQRADPPPIGSWITFRYQGKTATGLPRFARFLRRRPGGPPPEVTAEGRVSGPASPKDGGSDDGA